MAWRRRQSHRRATSWPRPSSSGWPPLSIETAAGRVPVVVSADGNGTDIAVIRARRAAALGAAALMVLPPMFIKPDGENLYRYYQRIARAVDIEIMVQDAPQLTGVALPGQLLARLNRDCPNITSVKIEGTPAGPKTSEVLALSDNRMDVFAGWGGLSFWEGLQRGAKGCMPAANFGPPLAEVYELYQGRRLRRRRAAGSTGWSPLSTGRCSRWIYRSGAPRKHSSARGSWPPISCASRPACRTPLCATNSRSSMGPDRFADVTTLGEIMLRYSVPAGSRLETASQLDVRPGGAESNLVALLARLGRHTAWVGGLPDNALGRLAANHLRMAGVDLGGVHWCKDGRMGTYYVEFSAPPRPIQVIYDRANSCATQLTPDHRRLGHAAGLAAAAPDRHHAGAVGKLPQHRRRGRARAPRAPGWPSALTSITGRSCGARPRPPRR